MVKAGVFRNFSKLWSFKILFLGIYIQISKNWLRWAKNKWLSWLSISNWWKRRSSHVKDKTCRFNRFILFCLFFYFKLSFFFLLISFILIFFFLFINLFIYIKKTKICLSFFFFLLLKWWLRNLRFRGGCFILWSLFDWQRCLWFTQRLFNRYLWLDFLLQYLTLIANLGRSYFWFFLLLIRQRIFLNWFIQLSSFFFNFFFLFIQLIKANL